MTLVYSHSNLSAIWLAQATEHEKYVGMTGNSRDEMTEEERDEHIRKLRLNCGWFQYIKVMSFFVSNCFAVPWRFVFDETTQTFRVSSPGWQKKIYIGLELTSLVLAKYRILNGIEVARTSKGDAFSFFDLASIFAIHVFEFACKILWWSRRERLQELIDEVQSSPLLKVASPNSNWRIWFHTGLFFFYMFTPYFYYCLMWGMVHWNWNDFYEVMQTSGEKVWGIEKSWESSRFYPVLLALNCFANLHSNVLNHCNDMMSVSWSLFMFNIAYDIREGMKSEKFTDREVLEMIDAQKRVTIKFNRTFGLILTMYSMYCSPFYAIHLIDMIGSPGFMNRYSNGLYLLYLGSFLCALSKITIMAKKRKRWLEKNSRYLHISHQQLAFLLDDIEWERFGVGGFVFISSALTSDIVSQISTMSMLLINIKGDRTSG
ncbi:unnamed protein product [Allacma fusca]|uniref:Uncharacterized protein n=1 Tax=Allacma fusca TaxID=39272 RepID=A0A8J2KT05_9HEXA|nr:unnamed protein product [Allacma fusca]